jgi:nucleoside-diphosphate-sugar epimerase
MKVLILGANGFLGTNLLKVLNKKKIEYLCLSRFKQPSKKLKFLRCDLSDSLHFNKIVKEFEPKICIDLSWEGIPDYSNKNNQYNFSIKKKIFKILNSNNCKKIISIGSCWEYGDKIGKVKENISTVKKLNNFAKTKIKLLKILQKYNKTNGLKFIWVRLFYVYGPNGKKTSLLESLIYNYKKGKKLSLKNYDGVHDYIYVKDACTAIKSLTFKNIKSGIYNLGSGNSYSNLEFFNTFLKILKINYKNTQFNLKENCLISDNTKIKKSIKWKNKYNLSGGLRETLKMYKMIK